MRIKKINDDILEVKMHLVGGHHDRALSKFEAMSDVYTAIAERDRIQGELLRHHIPIPACLGGDDLAGPYKALNDTNTLSHDRLL